MISANLPIKKTIPNIYSSMTNHHSKLKLHKNKKNERQIIHRFKKKSEQDKYDNYSNNTKQHLLMPFKSV